MNKKIPTISFVGAGPGDPELITLKGLNRIKNADIIVWAGSLVNPKILEYSSDDCEIIDSADLHLGQIIEIFKRAYKEGKKLVRLHTGDFSIYGSLKEQLQEIKKLGIPYELVPGVSSFLGAASSLECELTVPEVSQSVIISRIDGKTPVPQNEDIENLAKIGATMVLFLSAGKIDKVVEKLLKGAYTQDTHVAVVYKATWSDEIIIRGTLADIELKVKACGIRKHALIIVGQVLGDAFEYSKLYSKHFTHEFRKSIDE